MIISILYMYIVCTTSKGIGINKEKEIYLPNKESINGHRCERTNMDTNSEIIMNCSKTFIGIHKQQIWLKQGILKES